MWTEQCAFLDFAEKIYSNTVKYCGLGRFGHGETATSGGCSEKFSGVRETKATICIDADLRCHLGANDVFSSCFYLHQARRNRNMISIAPKYANAERGVLNRVVGLVSRVMQQTDDLVIVLEYSGKDGSVTRRVLSPIRFVGTDRFLALCLSREEPRQFYLSHCHNVRVDLAANYTMPVELQSVPESSHLLQTAASLPL